MTMQWRETPVTFISAGTDLGVHVDGARLGPDKLLTHLASKYRLDLREVPAPTTVKSHSPQDHAKNLTAVLEHVQAIYENVTQIITDGQFPVTVGGDHTVAMGSAWASRKMHGKLGLVWLDAHTDFHRLDTTITGNLHGLPLAGLTGYEPILNQVCPGTFYDPEHTIIVGARSVDAPEWTNLEAAGVRVYTIMEIHRQGLIPILHRALRQANRGTHGVHFSFDLDVVDPKKAPGVSVPEPHGLSLAQVEEAIDIIKKHSAVIKSFDLVEYNPVRDQEEKTLNLSAHILESLFNKC